jgi:hypothetical protein
MIGEYERLQKDNDLGTGVMDLTYMELSKHVYTLTE